MTVVPPPKDQPPGIHDAVSEDEWTALETGETTKITPPLKEFKWWWILLGLGVILIIVGGVSTLLSSLNGDPDVQPVASSESALAMELPTKVGDFTKDPSSVQTPAPGGADVKKTISARYTKAGQPVFIGMLSQPEPDAKSALTAAGGVELASTGNGVWCGLLVDRQVNACSVWRNQTAIIVIGLTDQDYPELVSLAARFSDAI